MDDFSLDRLLRERREQGRTNLPGSFSQNVWREIRQQKAQRTPSTLASALWNLLLRPQMVGVTLGMAITLGVGVGVQHDSTGAAQTHVALDLNVFGASSPALPATLLASKL